MLTFSCCCCWSKWKHLNSSEREETNISFLDVWSSFTWTISSSFAWRSRSGRCEFQCVENGSSRNAQSDEFVQFQTVDFGRRSTNIGRSFVEFGRTRKSVSTSSNRSEFGPFERFRRKSFSFRISNKRVEEKSVEFGTDRPRKTTNEKKFRRQRTFSTDVERTKSRADLGTLAVHSVRKTNRILGERNHQSSWKISFLRQKKIT